MCLLVSHFYAQVLIGKPGLKFRFLKLKSVHSSLSDEHLKSIFVVAN